MLKERLAGVYAAAVTPVSDNRSFDPESQARLLAYLRAEGCHGALLTGTTGEGMSFSLKERTAILKAARNAEATMTLLAGTGANSVSDAIEATRAAYAAGMDAALILPPTFYPSPDEDGLFDYFSRIFEQAVPIDEGALLYHNPEFAPGITVELVQRLRARFGPMVAGVKDSSGDIATAQAFCAIPDFCVLIGKEKPVSAGLNAGAAGAIWAFANVSSRALRHVYDLHADGKDSSAAQAALEAEATWLNGLPKLAALKTVLKQRGVIASDAMMPPLTRLNVNQQMDVQKRLAARSRA